MRVSARELLLGVGLDLVLGDPQWLPHPVRGIGWITRHSERAFRATRLPYGPQPQIELRVSAGSSEKSP